MKRGPEPYTAKDSGPASISLRSSASMAGLLPLGSYITPAKPCLASSLPSLVFCDYTQTLPPHTSLYSLSYAPLRPRLMRAYDSCTMRVLRRREPNSPAGSSSSGAGRRYSPARQIGPLPSLFTVLVVGVYAVHSSSPSSLELLQVPALAAGGFLSYQFLSLTR